MLLHPQKMVRTAPFQSCEAIRPVSDGNASVRGRAWSFFPPIPETELSISLTRKPFMVPLTGKIWNTVYPGAYHPAPAGGAEATMATPVGQTADGGVPRG